jgi:hypothetical protein
LRWRCRSSAAAGRAEGGSTAAILVWLGATAGVAVVLQLLGRKLIGVAVADGLAGGLFFSIGDGIDEGRDPRGFSDRASSLP